MPMTTMFAVPNRLDPRVLRRLDLAGSVGLGVTALMALATLAMWLVPGLATTLPGGWTAMKFNSAVVTLLAAGGLALAQKARLRPWRIAARVCGAAVVVIAGAALLEHLTGRDLGIDTLIVGDPAAAMPGRISLQGAICYLAIGTIMSLGRAARGATAILADALTLALVFFVLLLLAGVLFGATRLLETAPAIRPAPQSLFGIILLTLVVAGRRTSHGLFSLLAGVGIGSQVARWVLPASIAVTFLLIRAGERLLATGMLSLPYAAAVTAAGMAAILVLLVFPLAGRINQLEADLRAVSLVDELTGCHNRRGFDLVGGQVLREARRAGTTLTVIFVDADGLKVINDTLGHDAGSAFLRDMAVLLREVFRGSDVLGRIGGDEFAVLAQGAPPEVDGALRRLREATDAVNQAGRRPYDVAFSVGEVTVPPENEESLGQLLARADAAMYEAKRRRRAGR